MKKYSAFLELPSAKEIVQRTKMRKLRLLHMVLHNS